MSSPANITQLKSSLKTDIDNSNKLEHLSANATISDAHHVQQLQQGTSALLRRLKDKPAAKLVKVIKQRRQRRKTLKIKQKLLKRAAKKTDHTPVSTTTTLVNESCPRRPNKKISQKKLRCVQDAKRYLRTFELLQRLHLVRGHDPRATSQFSAKLSALKNKWLDVLQQNETECSPPPTIEQQWDETFFGAVSIQNEKCAFKDFLRIRNTWDSYLSAEANASAIPIGWVLPPKEPMPSWQQYKHSQ